MNQTLSKRSYSSAQEMRDDFWRIHYATKQTTNRPNERLWSRMHKDGPGSVASRLWDNQHSLWNTGRTWLPDHGPTVLRLFGNGGAE